jgi:hypothetical protein
MAIYGIPHDSVASISISPMHVPLKHNSMWEFQIHGNAFMLRDIHESPQQTTPAEIGGQRHWTLQNNTKKRFGNGVRAKSKFDKTIYMIDLFFSIKLRSFDKPF